MRSDGARPGFLMHTREGEHPALVPLGMAPRVESREAVESRLRAEAVSLGLRAAAVGAEFSGGAGLVLGDPETDKSPGLFRRIAAEVEERAGRVYLVQGFGMTAEDLEAIGRGTRYVLGLPRELGGSGDPSPFTAAGVFGCIRACVGELAGARVAVPGVGRVGSRLVGMLASAGAELTVADHDEDRAKRVASEHGARAGSVEEVLFSDCDVLSPNGRGPVFTGATIPKLRCRFIAGSGSGQAVGAEAEALIVERGIGYVPEIVAGSGWLLNLAAELLPGGYDEAAALESVLGVGRRRFPGPRQREGGNRGAC